MRDAPMPESSPPRAPIPAPGANGSTCAAFPASCGWRSSTRCNAAGTSARRRCALPGCRGSCGTSPPREPSRCWTGPKRNGPGSGQATSRPAAGASSSWMPALASSSWPSAAAGTWNTPATSGGCAIWASRRARQPRSISRRSASHGWPPWPSAGAGGSCQPGWAPAMPARAFGRSGGSPPSSPRTQPELTARHPSAARCWNATWPACRPPASARPPACSTSRR